MSSMLSAVQRGLWEAARNIRDGKSPERIATEINVPCDEALVSTVKSLGESGKNVVQIRSALCEFLAGGRGSKSQKKGGKRKPSKVVAMWHDRPKNGKAVEYSHAKAAEAVRKLNEHKFSNRGADVVLGGLSPETKDTLTLIAEARNESPSQIATTILTAAMRQPKFHNLGLRLRKIRALAGQMETLRAAAAKTAADL